MSEWQYCPSCGSRLDANANYCAKCGKSVSPVRKAMDDNLELKAEVARKSKRALIAYLLAFFITGTGHMYLGFWGKGISILLIAIVIGIMAAASGNPFVGLIFGLPLWIFQLWDVHKKIKKVGLPSNF